MSQSPKLSLWQRIKQLLNISAVQAIIDDIKAAKDLDLDLEVQTIINESAETLERNLRADMNINLDLLMTYLKREKKDFKPLVILHSI